MASLIGSIIGATVAMWLLSRLVLWLLKAMGDTPRRIILAHLVSLSVATVAAGFGRSDGSGPDFLGALAIYGGPALLWLVVDLLALKRRTAKAGGE
ncbi:MAG: hypothetical protein K1X35_06480 [Caulobacteraceae bacterium]|nr:hypothetical protein [Caulobacteraceae bacterium]